MDIFGGTIHSTMASKMLQKLPDFLRRFLTWGSQHINGKNSMQIMGQIPGNENL